MLGSKPGVLVGSLFSYTFSAFQTLPKDVVAPRERSEEDTRRRVECLGLTDYEEVQVAEAKAKHPPSGTMTSLHVAVRANDLASVKVFIRSGQFDVRATAGGGYTPLHVAAIRTNNPAMIHAIVQSPRGLDVLNTRNAGGETPLLLAAAYNHPDLYSIC